MTELQAEYGVKLEPPYENIECPHCGKVFGQVRSLRGKPRLMVAYGVYAHSFHGEHDCLVSGKLEQVNWDASDVLMHRITKRKEKRIIDNG